MHGANMKKTVNIITKNIQYRECIVCLVGHSVSELANLLSSLIENMLTLG